MKKLIWMIFVMLLLASSAVAEDASYRLLIENGVLTGIEGAPTTVTLTNDVQSVAPEALPACATLEEILVEEGHGTLVSADGVLLNAKQNTLIAYPSAKKDANYAVPEGVKTIGERAFYGNQYLENIIFPDTLRTVAECALYGAARITEIKLPRGVTTIGDHAFADCPALKKARLSERFYVGGAYAFANCTALEEADVPEGCKALGEGMFFGCEALESVLLSQAIAMLPPRAFAYCLSLETLLLPDELVSIGERAFYGCQRLAAVYLPSHIKYIEKEIVSPEFTQIHCYRYNDVAILYCRRNVVKIKLLSSMHAPRGLTLAAPKTMSAGQSGKILVSGVDSAKDVTFTSDSPLLTIDPLGNIKAGKVERETLVTVTATASGVRASVQIRLDTKILAERIEITPLPGNQLQAGKNAKMTARVFPMGAEQTVEWSSSDEKTLHIGFSKTAYAQSGVTTPTQVTLTAWATDGSGTVGTYTLTVIP